MEASLNDIVLYVGIPIWGIALIFISRWMYMAKPESGRTAKYSKRVIISSQRPFGTSWKMNVSADDLEVFEKFQRRIRIWYLFLILPFFIYMSIISRGA